MKKEIYYVIHYDTEDPMFTKIKFMSLTEQECINWINVDGGDDYYRSITD